VLGKDLCGIYDAVVHMATSFDEHAPELTQFLLRVVKEHCQTPVILAIGAATVEHKNQGFYGAFT
jgi:imidazole glycerol phosphate synthase subunit HisF